jgi:hypothetical protein
VSPASTASSPAAVKTAPPVAVEKQVKASDMAAAAIKGPRPPNPRPVTAVALPAVPALPVKPVELGLPVSQPRLDPGLPLESPGRVPPLGTRPGASVVGQSGPPSP